MFTGIVEELGTVLAIEGRGRDVRARIGATVVLEGAKVGDSTAVDGCCLTVVELGDGWFEADVSDESLRRTTLGARHAGDRVNLERPLLVTDRLGGHIVQGHVDAVGEVLAPVPDLRVGMPDDLRRYIIEKGSITVDGVSLTVVQPTDDGFTVAVIPHTAEVTTLGAKQPGDTVNLEVDLIAKYTERLLAFQEEP
ncbi:MAG TPA: riboflavin synthase [Acidimicrobiales bacterium]|jgi:riboflavin synthase